MLLLSSAATTHRKGPIYRPGRQRHDMYRLLQPSVMIESVPPLIADGIAANLTGSRFLPYDRTLALVASTGYGDHRLRFGFGGHEMSMNTNGTLRHEFDMQLLGSGTFSAGVVFSCPPAVGDYAIETSGGALFGSLGEDTTKLSVDRETGYLQFWVDGAVAAEYRSEVRDSVTRRVLICLDRAKHSASILVGDEPRMSLPLREDHLPPHHFNGELLIGNAGYRADDPFVGDLKAMFVVNDLALDDPRQQRMKTVADVWLISVMRGAPPDVSLEDLSASDKLDTQSDVGSLLG